MSPSCCPRAPPWRLWPSSPAAQPPRRRRPKAQLDAVGPCADGGTCTVFPPLASDVIRQITIDTPGRGSVLVPFNGSVLCSTGLSGAVNVADLAFQLVPGTGGVANQNGPGGQRVAFTISNEQGFGGAVSYRLNPSRTFSIARGGRSTYSLKLSVLRRDEFVTCRVQSGNMSALFVRG